MLTHQDPDGFRWFQHDSNGGQYLLLSNVVQWRYYLPNRHVWDTMNMCVSFCRGRLQVGGHPCGFPLSETQNGHNEKTSKTEKDRPMLTAADVISAARGSFSVVPAGESSPKMVERSTQLASPALRLQVALKTWMGITLFPRLNGNGQRAVLLQ